MSLVVCCNGQSKMNSYNLDKDDARQLQLDHKLKEISGIAFSADGRLFAHDDERAVVYQLDPATGEIIKSFFFGLIVKKGDFEDIEIVGKDFFLITSNGIIYKFPEGGNGQRVEYQAYDTDLKKGNNVEGLCFDPLTHTLLLALKGHPGAGLDKDFKTVYTFYLSTCQLEKVPRFVLDKKHIRELSKENEFEPSGIACHPLSGDFFVIASAGNLLVQIAADGVIKDIQKLSRKLHNQPEGIAFTKDGTLYIADEGKNHGTLTIYDPQ
jgi:uncharacterized protein YjiK